MQPGDRKPQSQSEEIVDRWREAQVEVSSFKKRKKIRTGAARIGEWRNADASHTFVMCSRQA